MKNWHAKCFVPKEGIVVLKYQLLKPEKYAQNMLSAVKYLPEPSVPLWSQLLRILVLVAMTEALC